MGRIVLGAGLVLAPRTVARRWIGAGASAPGITVTARALGARDLALGVGVLRALDRGEPVRGWVLAGAWSDALDAGAALAAARQVGLRRAAPAAALAVVAAVAGAAGASHMD